MTDWIFHTPGRTDEDLPQSIRTAWNDWHVRAARSNIDDMKNLVPGAPAGSIPYVNPAAATVPAKRTSVPVEWQGFPAQVDAFFGQDNPDKYPAAADKGSEDISPPPPGYRWAFVDSTLDHELALAVRHRQDEYLEWEPRFDNGVLRSITFVAEGWDYWEFLFAQDDKLTAQKYSDLLQTDVSADDLRFAHDVDLYLVRQSDGARQLDTRGVIRAGGFNWRNQLNQGPGIVHLSHRANSLGAEVNLAVTSALPRTDAAGQTVVASPVQRLICCTGGGEPNRSSDPRIAAAAYSSIVDKASPKFFTLTDPVGLYISEFGYNALQYPNDPAKTSAYEWWSVQRGKDASDPTDRRDSRILRLHLEVPPGEGFLLGQMKIEGSRITHPAQLAELIKMHLLVDIWPAPATAPAAPCSATCCTGTDGVLNLQRTPCTQGTETFPGLLSAAPAAPEHADLMARTAVTLSPNALRTR